MESNKVYKKVSIIVTIGAVMFIVLVFAFSINNVIAVSYTHLVRNCAQRLSETSVACCPSHQD